jgi:hypothetical protein
MNWLREKFSNLSITLGLLLVLVAFVLLGFGANTFGFSSDALLSLISAIIGGLIATSSQAWTSAQDRENQLRLAAIERRLVAHQEAYALWRKLIFTSNEDKEFGNVVLECQSWWNNNCLFLDSKSRKAFFDAFMAAPSRPVLLRSRDTSAIKENYEIMTRAGEIIVKGILLPTIGDESKFVQSQKSKKK